MLRVEIDDVAGVYVDRHQRILCRDCFKGDLRDFKYEDILTRDEVENADFLCFCDECGKAI